MILFSSLWLTAETLEMPGPEKTASTPVIAHLMESHALSEEDLFAPRQEEIPRIQNGSVTLILSYLLRISNVFWILCRK